MASPQDCTSFSEELERRYQEKNQKIVAQAWKDFTDHADFPFTYEDSVAFFYTGDARLVSWMGDFNGRGYDKSLKTKAHDDILIYFFPASE